MSEPVEFRVPPDDLRFLERAKRSRSPPPKLSAGTARSVRPGGVGRMGFAAESDPPRMSHLSSVALQTLLGYLYRTRPLRRVRELRQWAPPVGFTKVVCVGVASVLLALELIYFIVCRPDLRGRRIRVRLITPRDVQRIVYLRLGTARGLLNRVRM